jgi:hypothetical protein
MSRVSSPSHRDFTYLNAKPYQSITLQGKMSIKTHKERVTMGKWENFIGKDPKRSCTPASPSKRYTDYTQASRTLHPEMNDEQNKTQSKKILNVSGYEESPGNWSSLLKKTASVQDLNKIGKKVFKEKQIEAYNTPIKERRHLKGHPSKLQDWASQISGLLSPTQREEEQPRSPSPSKKLYLNSPINQQANSSAVLMRECKSEKCFGFSEEATPAPKETAKKHLARFLDTSVHNEAYQPAVIARRCRNKESCTSYLDDNAGSRINPCSRGKRAPSREQSNEKIISVYESLERFNPLSKGKKFISPRNGIGKNLYSMAGEAVASGKARSIYSYRTFSSQVPL